MHDIKEKSRYVRIKEKQNILKQRPPRRLGRSNARFRAVSKKLHDNKREEEQKPVERTETAAYETVNLAQRKAAAVYAYKRRNASHRETHSSFSPKQEQGRVSNIKERVHRGTEIKERKNVPLGEIKTRTAYERKPVKTDTVRVNAAKSHAIEKTQRKAKTASERARKLMEALKAAVKDGADKLLLAGGTFLLVLIPLVCIMGITGLMFGMGENSTEYIPVSPEVEAYSPLIQLYAAEHGIPEYGELIKAVMMQESGGRGNDPMQASECGFNTQYPRTPNGITDPEYSVNVGIQNLAACIYQAKVESPMDIEGISLALQGYNYGNGYITWAIANYGGYSTLNAIEFSDMMASSLGWSGYGDKQYVPHVLRYYPIGRIYMGSETQAMVDVALTQLGNVGGEPYWSWYGHTERVECCACFVSWYGEQCGYIEAGLMPKFDNCQFDAEWSIFRG